MDPDYLLNCKLYLPPHPLPRSCHKHPPPGFIRICGRRFGLSSPPPCLPPLSPSCSFLVPVEFLKAEEAAGCLERLWKKISIISKAEIKSSPLMGAVLLYLCNGEDPCLNTWSCLLLLQCPWARHLL